MPSIIAVGLAHVPVAAGNLSGFVTVHEPRYTDKCHILLTARVIRASQTPPDSGPVFVPFSEPGSQGAFTIWVHQLKPPPPAGGQNVMVDWALVLP